MSVGMHRADVREVVSRTGIDLLMMQQGGTRGHVGQGTFRGVETVPWQIDHGQFRAILTPRF